MRAQRIILALYLIAIVGGLAAGCLPHANCFVRC